VLRDKVAVAYEVVLLDSYRPKVVVDDAQDALEAVAALGTGRVIDHVERNEIIERAVVTGLLPTEHLVDDFLRTTWTHDTNVRRSSSAVAGSYARGEAVDRVLVALPPSPACSGLARDELTHSGAEENLVLRRGSTLHGDRR
jgi:hypothetical protein